MKASEYYRNTVGMHKGYRARQAERIMRDYNTINVVEIHERGDGLPGANGRPGVAVYVMSTGGRWGRSSELRIHHLDKIARRLKRGI